MVVKRREIAFEIKIFEATPERGIWKGKTSGRTQCLPWIVRRVFQKGGLAQLGALVMLIVRLDRTRSEVLDPWTVIVAVKVPWLS